MFGILLRLLPRSQRTSRYLRSVQKGDFKQAERILRSGIDLQAGLVPTVRADSIALLQTLLLSGASPGRLLSKELSELLRAVGATQVPEKTLQIILDAGLDSNARVGKLSLLNSVIMNRDERLVRTLLRNGAKGFERDPSGFTPMEMANALEEESILKILVSAGVEPAFMLTRDFEALFVNPTAYFSELHELVKWSIRNAGFEFDRVSAPRSKNEEAFLLLYRFHSGNLRLRIELEFLAGSDVALLLFRENVPAPLASLLPGGNERLDSSRLRGFVVTVLKDFREKGKFTLPQEEQISFSGAALKALEVLGLSGRATRQQILSAYRSLAKRYHPDVGTGSAEQMIEINRAYETLVKKT